MESFVLVDVGIEFPLGCFDLFDDKQTIFFKNPVNPPLKVQDETFSFGSARNTDFCRIRGGTGILEFLMDYLKTHAPFWKQVEKAGGKTGDKTGEKIWVEAKASDDSAADRWAPAPTKRETAS